MAGITIAPASMKPVSTNWAWSMPEPKTAMMRGSATFMIVWLRTLRKVPLATTTSTTHL